MVETFLFINQSSSLYEGTDATGTHRCPFNKSYERLLYSISLAVSRKASSVCLFESISIKLFISYVQRTTVCLQNNISGSLQCICLHMCVECVREMKHYTIQSDTLVSAHLLYVISAMVCLERSLGQSCIIAGGLALLMPLIASLIT